MACHLSSRSSAAADRPVVLAVGGMTALAAGIGIGRFAYTPILPAMLDGLHLSAGAAGFIASANFAGYLAGALLAASPRMPGSRRKWLVAALAVNAAATGMMGLSTSFALFVLLRFIGGLVSAFILVFASALVLDRLARCGRPSLAAVHFAGVGIGIAVSAAALAVVAQLAGDWTAMWLFSGALSLAAVPLFCVAVPADDAQQEAPPAIKRMHADKHLMVLVAAYGLFGFGYVITATFLVTVVRAAPEIARLEPYVWIIFGLSAAPSVAVWARLGDALGVLKAFAMACFLEAVGVVASVAWVSKAGVVTAAILLGGTFMGLTALGLTAARALPGGDPHRKIALMTAAFGLGQIVGPTFAGFLRDQSGSFVAPSLAAAAALCIAGTLMLLNLPRPAGARSTPVGARPRTEP
jgi:predicted MFS family arabinose efflux permease